VWAAIIRASAWLGRAFTFGAFSLTHQRFAGRLCTQSAVTVKRVLGGYVGRPGPTAASLATSNSLPEYIKELDSRLVLYTLRRVFHRAREGARRFIRDRLIETILGFSADTLCQPTQ